MFSFIPKSVTAITKKPLFPITTICTTKNIYASNHVILPKKQSVVEKKKVTCINNQSVLKQNCQTNISIRKQSLQPQNSQIYINQSVLQQNVYSHYKIVACNARLSFFHKTVISMYTFRVHQKNYLYRKQSLVLKKRNSNSNELSGS